MFKIIMMLLTGMVFQKPARKVNRMRSLKYTMIAKSVAKSYKKGKSSGNRKGGKKTTKSNGRNRKHKTGKKSSKSQPWQRSSLFK